MEIDPKTMSLDEIKTIVKGDTPKLEPETLLDLVAIERAKDRHARLEQQKALREWFIYRAPPGVYELWLEERKALQQEMDDRQSTAKKLLAFLLGMLITFAILQLFYPELMK